LAPLLSGQRLIEIPPDGAPLGVELGAGCGHGRRQKGEHEEIDKPLRGGGIDVKGNDAVRISIGHTYGYIPLILQEEDIRESSHGEGHSGHHQYEYAADEHSPVDLPVGAHGHEPHC